MTDSNKFKDNWLVPFEAPTQDLEENCIILDKKLLFREGRLQYMCLVSLTQTGYSVWILLCTNTESTNLSLHWGVLLSINSMLIVPDKVLLSDQGSVYSPLKYRHQKSKIPEQSQQHTTTPQGQLEDIKETRGLWRILTLKWVTSH